MDSELFELCKKVYVATGWETPETMSSLGTGAMGSDEMTCKYTTDYILEKLPVPLIFNSEYSHSDAAIEIRRTKKDKYKWSANIRPVAGQYYKQVADTPLKAVLKLVLVLKEEGQI